MTDDGHRRTAQGDDSPWAPGGAMAEAPIPEPPRFFEPAATTPPPGAGPGGSESSGAPSGAGGGTPAAQLLSSKWARVAAIAGVVVVAVAGVVLLARDDGPDDPVTEPEPTVSTTEAPSTSTTNPDPFEEASVGPPTEVLRGGTGDGFDGVLLDVPVQLPAVLDDVAPTELVVLGTAGQMYQVTTSTRLATPLTLVDGRDARFAATDDAVVIWNDDADSIGVLRRGREPIELPVQPLVGALVPEADGEFLIAPTSADAAWRELRIEPVVRTLELDVDVGVPWSVWPHPGGDLMVTDREGEGTLLLGPDGPTPISSGVTVATGRNHVLFRECDAAGTCTHVLTTATGERTEPPGLAGVEEMSPIATISPDGTALARFEFDNDGEPRFGIRDLESGEVTEVPAHPRQGIRPPVHWSPDGRGVFAIAGQEVVFIDRETGELTALPGIAGLLAGDPAQIAVRPVPAPEVTEGSIVVTLSGLTGIDLVAFAPDGDIVRIDIDGRVTTTYEGQPLLSGAPAYVVPDADGVTVASSEDVPGFRLDYGGTPVQTASEPFTGRILPGPGLSADRYWQVPEFRFGETQWVQVDAAGTPVDDPIVIQNALVLGSDGTGSVLVYTAGGDFVVGPDGAVRLTDGEILAVGAAAAYARECDEVLVCRIVRIDRVSGGRTTVDVPELETATTDPSGIATLGQTVSPDGDVAFVQVSANSLAWSMVDVAAGTVLEVPGPGRVTPIVWSDDSQYAVYVSGDILRLYDRAAGVLKDFSQLPRIKTFAEFVPPAAGDGGEGGEIEGVRRPNVVPRSFRR